MTSPAPLTFAANLSMIFTELAFLDRFAAAAEHGFSHVEFMFPYEFAANDIARRLERHGLRQVLFNLHPGDWAGGERGLAVLPDRVAAFRSSVAQALDYADALGCRQLHALAGVPPAGANADRLAQTYRDNLVFAADAAAKHGVTILIEPINTIDIPGYWLGSLDRALETLSAINHPHLALQFDAYHLAMMERDIIADLHRAGPRVAHVQIADAPGRHEPGTGTIDFTALFAKLQSIGYSGAIGLEYRPKTTTSESLQWLRAMTA